MFVSGTKRYLTPLAQNSNYMQITQTGEYSVIGMIRWVGGGLNNREIALRFPARAKDVYLRQSAQTGYVNQSASRSTASGVKRLGYETYH